MQNKNQYSPSHFMKRNLISVVLWIALLYTPTSLFCQKQGALLIKGRDISASPASLKIFKRGLLKDSLYTIPVQNGDFYALLNLDEGVQQVAVLIGNKPILFYASSGDIIDITCDFTKSRLIKIEGSTPLKTQLLSYDASATALAKRDSVFANIISKAANDSEKYRLCAYYYNIELNDLLSKRKILKQEIEQYINELYFSYANKMSAYYSLYFIDRLVDTTATQIPDGGIVPEAYRFKIVSKKIFLQSPAYREYLFNAVRFNGSDSAAAELMIKFSGDVHKAAPWREYQKAKYISDPYIKEWFEAKSVVFSFKNYNTEEADKVMKLFLSECQSDLLKEKVVNAIKGITVLQKGFKAPGFILQDELGRTVSLADFAGKVIYLNFWGIHCGSCMLEIKNELPLLRDKYKDIVMISICIEGKTAEWKNTITKYNMKYINLYDTTDKAIKDYNISSVPHNILIDKQGNIFEYNAGRPDVYIKNGNSIDELLKQ